MVVRIILAIATLLTVLFCLVLAVWGIIAHQALLAVVCALLAIMFGVFLVKSDYSYFSRPKG
jgi:hypothetical protein